MKPVLIQNLLKKHRRQQVLPDHESSDVKKERDRLFNIILAVLAVIVIGSIAIAA